MSRVASVPYETTLLVRDCCLCLHVQRAARSLARRFDEELRELGLTNGQFSLLMSLNRPKPPGIADLQGDPERGEATDRQRGEHETWQAGAAGCCR